MNVELTIPFPFPIVVEDDNLNVDILTERYAFWDSPAIFQWFEARGYTLYKRMPTGEYDLMPNNYTVPRLPSEPFVQAEYPHPYHENYSAYSKDYIRCAQDTSGKVVFAQDSQCRHVAIKLVPNDTNEIRILQFLRRQSPETLKEHCLIPILDILPIKGFSFAVMPRWGSSIYNPAPNTLRDVVGIIHSMLKGLSFPHHHNIIHRDICLRNVLVNHFSNDHAGPVNPTRVKLRSAGNLSYAIFDFDVSVMVPPDVEKSEFRLPYKMSWCGSYNHPFDTAQGEFDYDPFAYDVGTMGREFCQEYQHLSASLPLLAPLLDGMITRNISRRFTAAQALQFLETELGQLPDKHLEQEFYEATDVTEYDKYDRWRLLPSNLVQKWAVYKEPPLPATTRFLRWLYSFESLVHVIPFVRRAAFHVWRFPYRFSSAIRLRH
ncbi:unnamed protein product [Cyclocybe aegerita]|uniref:Protein kinase domain-containing protein n=1 Tax=Cyclocybe aegerita TaxID=1973307 RepID=A0A8S0WXU4_CYCAE|nr:unnamed protein product [Cyclocybe aegerita]